MIRPYAEKITIFFQTMIHELAYAFALSMERPDNTESTRAQAIRIIQDSTGLDEILRATEPNDAEDMSEDWMIQFVSQNAARIALRPRFPQLSFIVYSNLKPFDVHDMVSTIRLHSDNIRNEVYVVRDIFDAMAASA